MLLKNDLKRSLLNPGMALAIGITLLMFVESLYSNGLFPLKYSGGELLSNYQVPMALSSYVQFACVFPMLPYAFSYLEEKNSGYVKYILQRMSPMKYIVNKIFWCGISGGMACVVPSVFLFIYLNLISDPSTKVLAENVDMIWDPYCYIWGGNFVLLLKLVVLFMFGVLWAEITLLISLFIHNRYIVFVIPFMIYIMTWMLLPGNLDLFKEILYVRGDFSLSYSLCFGIATPFVMQSIYIAIVCVAILQVFQRRKCYV